MLTQKDLKSIEKVVEKVVDDRFERKFKPFQEETHQILGDIFADLQEHNAVIRKLDTRVSCLESIHPDNSHVAVM